MRQFISLLLIPMFVLGQVLPHSHAGSDIVAPDEHADRPHIHLSVHHHHHGEHAEHGHHGTDDHEHDGDHGTPQDSSTEHDSDAIYLIDCDLAGSRSADSVELDAIPLAWISVESVSSTVFGPGLTAGDPPDRRPSALPVYLLTASLRL